MGLMNLAVSGHRMTGRWAYPIARERRANVLWLSSLLDSTAYFALAMLALPAIYAIGLPQVSIIDGGTTRYGLIAPLLVAFATAPIVQWPRVTSHLAPPKLKQFGPLWLRISYRCVWAVTIVTFVLEFLFFITRFASMNVAALVGVLIGIGFHYYYWVNLRDHFRTADLA